MENIILCRLCLANSINSNVIATNKTIQVVLQKYNISFPKRDFSSKTLGDVLTHLCDLCWHKIDEFHQFYLQIEQIQSTYNSHFIKDDGSYVAFDDINQYYIQVDRIHSAFASQLLKEFGDSDKKLEYMEPFCIINVDENDSKSRVNLQQTVDNDRLSTTQVAAKAKIVEDKGQELLDEVKVKTEEDDRNEPLANSADVLNTDPNDDCGGGGASDDSAVDDDYKDDDEDDESSDSSFVQRKPTVRIRNKNTKTKKKKKSSVKNTKNLSSKKIPVSFNVLDESNKRLLQYVQMKCDVCCDGRIFESFADIQMHFLDVHRQSGYIMCCNRKFRRIGRVLQHCTWHDNPEAFKCDTCNKCFQDNVCLRDHITSMHIPVDERRFQCDQCSRLFAKQHLLNTHLKMKHTVKEERPYVCPEGECGQRFVLPAYLRLHIEKVHNHGDSRVCDICARFFKCSKSYERHYQVEHTDIDQRVQCDLCQKWFKHLDTLKDHIRRHYAASATCKYCGRVSSNKKSLRLHIRNVHADIDSSVKTRNEYPCTVCEKIFKKKQTLREHMTLHTGEAYLYTCTFCSKTFRSSANMYAHRKRNHPREYEEKCVLAKTQKI